MGKSFDVAAAQLRATELRHAMAGKRYRHYKGGTYRVMWVDVDEATGEPRVSYRSETDGGVWNRTYANFSQTATVGEFAGKARFELIPGPAFTREPGPWGDEPPPDVDIRGGERGKYAKRYNTFHTVKLIGTGADATCAGGCGATVGELLTTGHHAGCKLGSTDGHHAEANGGPQITLGNCVACGRTLHVRGYRCPTHGLACAYCVHDWKCPKCDAHVELETNDAT